MRILQITAFSGWGCTGRFALGIHRKIEETGNTGAIAWGRVNTAPGDVPTIQIGTPMDYRLHGLYTRLTDRCGFGSASATERFLKTVDEWKPDLVQFHILHGYFINLELLFNYLKEKNIPTVWTFYDCWAFTGHCPYFDAIGCDKWKTGCFSCPQKRNHPESWFFDRSKENWLRKKALYGSMKNLTIVTPSEWLAGLVKQSFLKEHRVEVIPSGISTANFHPTPGNIHEKLGISGKKIVLGVSSTWVPSKGLADFLALRKLLPEEYRIVLVGLTKEQIETLPEGITGIMRTDSVQELAEFYTAASVFVNPTYNDNYPTTNLESISCGTPVITYETGGSPESIRRSGYGRVVPQKDVEGIKKCILELEAEPPKEISSDFIAEESELNDQYIRLYQELIG